MYRRLLCALLLIPSLGACAATPGNIPTQTLQQRSVSSVDFGNGQTGSLNLTRQGNQVDGELTISNPSPTLRSQALSRSLQFGSYALTGSFTPPKGFSVTGNFPAPIGTFTVSGNFPSLTEPGSATLEANGETVSIELPALNTIPSPSPTSPSPTASPSPSPTPSASASPAISTKVWTEAELETIVACFNSSFNPKDPPSIGAFASGRSRLTAYISTKNAVSLEAHQSRLNALGVDLIRLNNQYHFSCVN